MIEHLYQVKSSYFTAGFTIRNGVVYTIAPILKRMYSWDLPTIKAFCEKKRWELSELKEVQWK